MIEDYGRIKSLFIEIDDVISKNVPAYMRSAAAP